MNSQIIKNPSRILLSAQNEFSDIDRVDSLKAAVIGAVFGSIGALPFTVLHGVISKFDGQWEFSVDMLALTLALFGVTYRYIVRENDYQRLREGAVGAFAVTRALNMIQVPAECASLPLDCGDPFHYFSISMLIQGIGVFSESLLAFGSAAYFLEKAFSSDLLKKFPGAY
eukprot:CAMPEP_0182432404 /NCGR_PEP_ID=MMETSP1167-20130531/56070_1 /TAXON_ID=2988 /ORGANISM="Mallomonas Sp, Strain CCMP3275" /LENGTH=169 /DNA_ID=CAMNT_0024619869 /DNA_START=61 /DNA_END=570 /DNA_ORIENTATION=-